MAFASQYLSKQRGIVSYISETPSDRLKYIIVIPVYCEPDLSEVLVSLWNCDRPAFDTEVILVINAPEGSSEAIQQINYQTRIKAAEWIEKHPDPRLLFHIILCDQLPLKDAGVGLARKIGMDEAVYRFNLINQSFGYIFSFDADCRCDRNYLTAVEAAVQNTNVHGFHIYFEHPISGSDFSQKNYEGIIAYETHLRYVNQFLRYCGFPFAHHTVGSCFGVRADIYASQGGMNKRKAGEDFYFLHKIIPLGHFIDITATRVIPSPRDSFRVPFGTGVAIGKFLQSNTEITTYHPDSFTALKQFFDCVPEIYKANADKTESIIARLPQILQNFLKINNAITAIAEVNANCRTLESFTNRFFRWFDAFRIVKFLNYARLNGHPAIAVNSGVRQLLKLKGESIKEEMLNNIELLEFLRTIEKN